MHEWLTFALICIGIWLTIYLARPFLRKQMSWVSGLTSLAGLTEPLFVPKYWNPPSLFDLASRTHFDIESFIFAFAIGGIGSVLYEAALNVKHQRIAKEELNGRRWLHMFSLTLAPVVFIFLFLLTSLNPIYSAAISMFVGAVAATLCRPDLSRNTWVGGIFFTVLYFVFFYFINLLFPYFISSWNLSALSGVLILGVPLEELMFALTFGMFWSGIYEHVKHYALH